MGGGGERESERGVEESKNVEKIRKVLKKIDTNTASPGTGIPGAPQR